jgi:hypothetical protein
MATNGQRTWPELSSLPHGGVVCRRSLGGRIQAGNATTGQQPAIRRCRVGSDDDLALGSELMADPAESDVAQAREGTDYHAELATHW